MCASLMISTSKLLFKHRPTYSMLPLPKYRSAILLNGKNRSIFRTKSSDLMSTKTNEAIYTDNIQFTPIYK